MVNRQLRDPDPAYQELSFLDEIGKQYWSALPRPKACPWAGALLATSSQRDACDIAGFPVVADQRVLLPARC